MKLVIALVVLIIGFGIYLVARQPAANDREEIVIKGSDTEVQLVSNLAEQFSAKYKDADLSVTGGGSGVGLTALIAGEIDIANSSRPMKDEEKNQAKENGFDIQEVVIARDGLSVITHPTNPIATLTLDQVAKIYRGEITNWREVGGVDQSVTLYGRQSTSGTYVFFRDVVVKADYAAAMRNMEGNQAILDAVKSDESGVGYVGVGYSKDETGAVRQDIKIVSIKANDAAPAVSPVDRDAVLRGDYPIIRPIYQYLKQVPAKDSLVLQFVRFEVSDEGIAIVEKAGFYPLTAIDSAANDTLFAKIQ